MKQRLISSSSWLLLLQRHRALLLPLVVSSSTGPTRKRVVWARLTEDAQQLRRPRLSASSVTPSHRATSTPGAIETTEEVI
jgi:hypothetical protein